VCACVSLWGTQRVNQTQEGRFRTILSRSWPKGRGMNHLVSELGSICILQTEEEGGKRVL
jgi:hypothetical protein